MANIRLESYLFFKGNCREAMEFYKSIFGGELSFQTYGDVGAANADNDKDNIMHAKLEGGLITLMASDTSMASPKMAKVSLSLNGTDEKKLHEIFGQLSEGVEVKHPLKKEFWGDTYGDLTDKYGIDWMVNIEAKKE